MVNIVLYQQFIVDYFKSNPKEIKQLFEEPEASEVLGDALIHNNWELDDDSHYFDDQEHVEKLQSLKKQYGNDIQEFHRLALLNDKYCGQVVYLIVESAIGKLYMDEYVGD